MVNKFRQIQELCESISEPDIVELPDDSDPYTQGFHQGYATGQWRFAQTVLALAFHGRQASAKQGDPNA